MKCSICAKKIEATFLNKIIGTNIKDIKGKMHPVCFECQKKLKGNKQEMLSRIK